MISVTSFVKEEKSVSPKVIIWNKVKRASFVIEFFVTYFGILQFLKVSILNMNSQCTEAKLEM